MLLAVVVANGAALALVLGRGTTFMLGPLGGLLQLPIVLVLAAVVHQVLTRILGMPPERTGLVPRWKSVRELGLGLGCGVAGVVVIASLVLGTAEARGITAPSGSLLVGLVSFTVNAGLQQLGLVGLALAFGPSDRAPTPAGFAVALLFFVATHASESVAPIYLSNVALFGLATLGLFAARRDLAWAVGLHGAWNTTLVFVGGASLEGPGTLELVAWTPHDELWSGGAAGFEHGLANTLVCALVAAAAWGAARRGQGM